MLEGWPEIGQQTLRVEFTCNKQYDGLFYMLEKWVSSNFGTRSVDKLSEDLERCVESQLGAWTIVTPLSILRDALVKQWMKLLASVRIVFFPTINSFSYSRV